MDLLFGGGVQTITDPRVVSKEFSTVSVSELCFRRAAMRSRTSIPTLGQHADEHPKFMEMKTALRAGAQRARAHASARARARVEANWEQSKGFERAAFRVRST